MPKYPRFSRSPRHWLFLLLAFVITITPRGYAQSLDDGHLLNQQGFQFLHQGRPEHALERWKSAEVYYRANGNPDAIRGSQLNQATALQAMGQTLRACSTLRMLTGLPPQTCTLQAQTVTDDEWTRLVNEVPQGEIETLALTTLGDVLRDMGYLAGSNALLVEALHREPGMTGTAIQLSLAATQATAGLDALRSLHDTAGDFRLEHRKVQAATRSITEATALLQGLLNRNREEAVLAQVELFNLLARARQLMRDIPATSALASTIAAGLPAVEQRVLQADFATLSALDSIYVRLKAAHAWLAAYSDPPLTSGVGRTQALAHAHTLANAALREAIALQNDRAMAFAYGSLAAAKAFAGEDATAEYQTALDLAHRSRSWDAIYTWGTRLARLSQERGEAHTARAYYAEAIDALDHLRKQLTGTALARQFSFNADIQPVYRELMNLVSDDPNTLIETFEALTTLELEAYLQCNLTTHHLTRELQPNETILYLIVLNPHRLAVIAKRQSTTSTVFVDLKQLQPAIENLLLNTQSPNFIAVPEDIFLPDAQALYTALLKPLEAQGVIHPNDHVIVFPDSSLRNIPFSLLHDGQSYLIERYRMSTLIEATSFAPQIPHHSPALVAGLSDVAPSFALENAPSGIGALPQVEDEIARIQTYVDTTVLLNDAFTEARTRQKAGQYPVVHLSTHGQFSSDPERTVLLAWDQALDTFDLYELFDTFERGAEEGIDLLILSACQTAAGDERAALGIAGIAAQAGARSTLATLWLVDADSTTLLIDRLYQALSRHTTSEALRQAQLALLQSEQYSHPFFWASFVLVGRWE